MSRLSGSKILSHSGLCVQCSGSSSQVYQHHDSNEDLRPLELVELIQSMASKVIGLIKLPFQHYLVVGGLSTIES